MKRILSILLTLVFAVSLLSFAACSKESPEEAAPPAMTEEAPYMDEEEAAPMEEEIAPEAGGEETTEEAPAE